MLFQYTWGQGPSLLKKFGGDNSYCLRFDDVTIILSTVVRPFCKMTKWGVHYGIDIIW